MRNLKLIAAVGLSLLLVSCGNETPTPTGPEAVTTSPAYITCPTPTVIRTQINALFPRGVKQAAGQAFYVVMQIALAKKDTAAARQVMFVFLKYTLFEYQRGGLIGGTSAATQANLTTLTASLYCVVGLPAPVIPPSALGPDGAIGIVDPGSPTTVIVNSTQVAGVQVPAGAAPTTTLITVSRLPDSPGPLLTPLDQYPAYYQYTASPPVTFTQDVTVGICQVANFLPPDFSRLKVGHNVGPAGFELLPRVSATFLNPVNCNSLFGTLDRKDGLVNYVLRGMGRVANAVLLPQVVQASAVGTCCLGGTTKKFSPFGAVDTLANVSALSPTSFTAPAGGGVPTSQLPSVKLVTPTGHPVQGFTVTFSVPVGSQGTITGATQVTDASGIATAAGWTLGGPFSPDSVFATVTPFPGSGVTGNPVLFVAQPSLTVLPYGSAGYRYLLTGTTPPTSGFELPTFDFSTWLTGVAGFGDPNAPGCAIASTVQTNWPIGSSASSPSYIAARHSFPVPTGWTGGATLGLAIDNDAQVFVNGNEISDGLITHEGCATQGSFHLNIPDAYLYAGGPNEVEVLGSDRGSQSFLDLEIMLNSE